MNKSSGSVQGSAKDAVELFRLRYSTYARDLDRCADEYNKLMRGKMPKVVINNAYYTALEKSRKLFAVGARYRGKLIGVISFIVSTSPHYATNYIIAKHDFHYVDPAYRAGFLPVTMIRSAERALYERGVRRIFYVDHVRFQNRAAAMRRMGYTPVETMYEKILTPKPTRGGHASAQGLETAPGAK